MDLYQYEYNIGLKCAKSMRPLALIDKLEGE